MGVRKWSTDTLYNRGTVGLCRLPGQLSTSVSRPILPCLGSGKGSNSCVFSVPPVLNRLSEGKFGSKTANLDPRRRIQDARWTGIRSLLEGKQTVLLCKCTVLPFKTVILPSKTAKTGPKRSKTTQNGSEMY